jgi:hypothetical protein
VTQAGAYQAGQIERALHRARPAIELALRTVRAGDLDHERELDAALDELARDVGKALVLAMDVRARLGAPSEPSRLR